jgi:hypothetical protein
MYRTLMIAGVMLLAPSAIGAAIPVTPQDILIEAAFTAQDKATALARIASAQAAAQAILAQVPGDEEALVARAMATSYRAKLNRDRAEALSARAQLEALVARNPLDAEAQAGLGGWHLSAVASLGALVARGGLGARRQMGLDALDRAVALGGDRAVFRGLAALLRLSLDPRDPLGASLAEAASHGTTPTALDGIMQRRAAQMSEVVKRGDSRLVQALAKRLLPFGQFGS